MLEYMYKHLEFALSVLGLVHNATHDFQLEITAQWLPG